MGAKINNKPMTVKMRRCYGTEVGLVKVDDVVTLRGQEAEHLIRCGFAEETTAAPSVAFGFVEPRKK